MATLVTCFWAMVTEVLPIMPLLLLAWTLAIPNDTPVSRPVLSIVAIAVGLVLHVTWDVTSPVELFPNLAVAVYCWVVPG